MKRLAAFLFVAFLFWGITPAWGNTIPSIRIACDSVTVAWTGFPTRPVDLTVSVLFDDQNSTSVVSTGAARDGSASVQLDLHGTGTASVLVTWTLRKEHQSGPVTADLACESPVTPPSTTPPTTPPTSVPRHATYRMIPPVSAGPELPNTGAATTAALLLAGWLVVGVGVALVWGARVRRDEQ